MLLFLPVRAEEKNKHSLSLRGKLPAWRHAFGGDGTAGFVCDAGWKDKHGPGCAAQPQCHVCTDRFRGKKLCRNDRAFADHRGRAAFVRGGIVSTFPACFFLRPELFVEKENWLWNFTACDGSIALLLQSVLCLAGIQHAEWFPVPLCVSLCVCGVDHCGRGIPKTGGTQCIYAGRIVACDRSRCSQRQPVGIR